MNLKQRKEKEEKTPLKGFKIIPKRALYQILLGDQLSKKEALIAIYFFAQIENIPQYTSIKGTRIVIHPGEVYTSYRIVSEMLGLSRRTVRNAVLKLIDLGWFRYVGTSKIPHYEVGKSIREWFAFSERKRSESSLKGKSSSSSNARGEDKTPKVDNAHNTGGETPKANTAHNAGGETPENNKIYSEGIINAYDL